MAHVIIVGGGIAGLATALELRDQARALGTELAVTLFEAAPRVGGNIRTDRDAGWTIEWGPNGYLDSVPATPALAERVGLGDRIQPANEKAAKRFLYRNGTLHLLPMGPVGFLKSGVLSPAGRARVLMEPLAHPKPSGIDETIYEFASRRIGSEAANTLIDAMVSGVFAGNIHTLSLASTFPKMAAMEAEHGGLVLAMLARMRARRVARRRVQALQASGAEATELTRPGGPAGPAGTLTSFDGGLDLFPTAIAEHLGSSVRVGIAVERLTRSDGVWRVALSNGESETADAVMLAVPASHAALLVDPLDPSLARALRAVPSAGLAVAALGYDADAIGGPPDGFGFLVPRGAGPRILGCLWDSSLFPGRAPAGKVLMRIMIGGAHDPEAVALDDDELLSIVKADLRTTMGITAEPALTRIYRHPGGIAQYTVGHAARLSLIRDRLATVPGLFVGGSSYDGVAMNACIEAAATHAESILRSVAATTPAAASAAPLLVKG
jgi:oxygen-dependent protoporphyrinogen oxidase